MPASTPRPTVPSTELPTGPPSEHGVDPGGITALVDALEGAADIEPHSVVVLRHGVEVAAGWWAPYTRDEVHLLYSLSKSFTSTAAGLAVADGLLDPDATVLSSFPEFDADITDGRSRRILVRHVASMASGHTAETLDRAMRADPDEPVRGFLLTPPDAEPGSVFAYNQPCTYSLAAIVQRVTGHSLTQYLRARVLDPLGVGPVGWTQYPAGRDIGFSGLHATTDAIARLGQLYLDGGVWRGEQLLPPAWVAAATRVQVANPGEPTPDWQQGYGYQFWMSRHGYRGDGAYGQFCLVLPEHDAVVAITSATTQMQAVLDAVWTHLLPALSDDVVSDPAADEALAARLGSLALPVPAAAAEPDTDPAGWTGGEFRPAGGRCAEQPSLTGVRLSRDDDGWELVLVETDEVVRVRPAAGRWAVADALVALAEGASDPVSARGVRPATGPVRLPVAVSGGWTGPDTARFEVVFRETPHRLVLTCTLADNALGAAWSTTPLDSGPLRRLCAPTPFG